MMTESRGTICNRGGEGLQICPGELRRKSKLIKNRAFWLSRTRTNLLDYRVGYRDIARACKSRPDPVARNARFSFNYWRVS